MIDHANELRRHARKIPHPQGETSGVMLRAADEIECLRAKIAEMERQKPIAHVWRCDNGHIHGSCESELLLGQPLYTLPGAQPAPSVPDHKTIRDLLNESGLCAYDREGDLAFMVAATKFAALAAAPKPEAKP